MTIQHAKLVTVILLECKSYQDRKIHVATERMYVETKLPYFNVNSVASFGYDYNETEGE